MQIALKWQQHPWVVDTIKSSSALSPWSPWSSWKWTSMIVVSEFYEKKKHATFLHHRSSSSPVVISIITLEEGYICAYLWESHSNEKKAGWNRRQNSAVCLSRIKLSQFEVPFSEVRFCGLTEGKEVSIFSKLYCSYGLAGLNALQCIIIPFPVHRKLCVTEEDSLNCLKY